MRKTTLNLDETVMARLKEEAARRETTMGALVEAGIRRILAEGEAPPPAPDDLPPLPTYDMGEPLVDITDREALYEALDRERDERLYGTPAAPVRLDAIRPRDASMSAVADAPVPYDASGEAHDRTDGP